MMKSAIVACAVAGAAAFAPSQKSAYKSQLALGLDDIGGSSLPIPNFDPLNLATSGSDETLLWYRAAELKHGRVAMVATTGYLVNAAGIHFPGMLSSDVSFESLSSMSPIDAWDAVPSGGKAQILFTIFLAELITEGYQGTHYTKGGSLPTMVFPAIDFSNVSEEMLTKKRQAELNNGRLAMIAILSFISEHNIPGSVPALTNNGGHF
mmetsp:Transcript_37044/g.88646  ORF Transcript_37044/g.88646 Transcript_37044/m.88646 type:complete len:208 (-) Transcript_37044:1383-2006(-)